MSKINVSTEVIERFLQGSDEQKYIVAIESNYHTNQVHLIINDPETGKRIDTANYKPFLWFKDEVYSTLYGGKKFKIIQEADKCGVKITKLRTSNDEGISPTRLENGFKFMATCSKSYNDLVNFFKNGGVDIFGTETYKLFVMFSPTEQFMIQTGKRLFKGMDDYSEIHRLQFDLETEGLFASKNAIFQIGIRDNKGIEVVLETIGKDGYEKRDSEKENIEKFFKIIDVIQPDIITGYNSEGFDWPFLFERAERLSIPITELAITLNRISKIKRKPSTVKLGGETEKYDQTNMWGYNIIDISHAVRRAMAINSEIKSWGLKYITQYSEIAKPNRVYVPGDKINTTWADKINSYAFNDDNGNWYKISESNPLKEGYVTKTGAFIVQRYLCDDLWETEQIDNIFNQASFLIGKMLPTSFQRSSTMGTAGQWKLIMSAWSYENGLAIPELQTKREFTGGLSRLLEVGYAKNVVKLDYAALYPKTQLTHDIFPDLDITGVMEGMLTYVVDTRDKFKFLTGKEKKIYKKLEAQLKDGETTLSAVEKTTLKEEINKHKSLANLYDKKQLPLKILANSWFGSYGAPYIFNWGDTDSAEETTCRGRQYLRLMVRYFTEKHGFRALVGDSVTYDTPVYIKYPDNNIITTPICDLFTEITIDVDGQQRDFSNKNYQILTRNGWKTIHYIYRHKTTKKMFDIRTKDRQVVLTEDHSIFVNNKKVLPSTLNIGDNIDIYDINNLKVISDKIISKEEYDNGDDFVYDISTEDGSFIAGLNGVCCSNTDGFNFSFPNNINDIKYIAKGNHWKTTQDAGKELSGLDAVLAEFNENYMKGRMGLDIDDICNSTINFARKNYANDIGGKIKLVGNSIKSKKMPVYIEDFINKAIRLLLDGDGYEFIRYYYEYVDKIYNFQIPLVKIASKAKVKLSINDYKRKATMKNKNGLPLPKQAHMELAMNSGLDVNLGDVLYYINTGNAKSHGDLKTQKNKETGVSTITLNCKLIEPEVVERDFELIKELEMLKKALIKIENKTNDSYLEIECKVEEINNNLFTDEYNVARYLDAFNKKIKPLLVCFDLPIRDKILLNIVKVKDKVTKTTTEKLKERLVFTKNECKLVHGKPLKEGNQDSYEDLMKMEDKEIKFWDKVNKIPNEMEETEWNSIRTDYHERMRITKEEGIVLEKTRLDDIFKHLELETLNQIKNEGILPIDILQICSLSDITTKLVSNKWGVELCDIFDIFKYENVAIERDEYYRLVGCSTLDSRYEQWLEYSLERQVMTGSSETTNVETDLNTEELGKLIKTNTVFKQIPEKLKTKKKTSENDNDEDDEDIDDDSNRDEDLILDDEFDDTIGDKPDETEVSIITQEEIKTDTIDWGF